MESNAFGRLVVGLLLSFTCSGQYIDWVKQVKNKPFVDVREFGAKGDGVTDDTTAIQNAINSLVSSGGTLVIPPGTYNITTLSISNGNNQVHLNIQGGSGYGSTKLKCTGDNTAIVATNLVFSNWSNFLVDATDTPSCINGIKFTSSAPGNGSHQVTLTNIGVGNFIYGYGIQLGDTLNGEAASEFVMINPQLYSNDIAINMEDPNTGTVNIYGLRASANGTVIRYGGNSNFGGMPVNVYGGSVSQNAVDFKLINPCVFNIYGLLSEGKGNDAYGKLLEVGVAGVTPAVNFRISVNGTNAYHYYKMGDFKSITIDAPTDLSINDSHIGNGYIQLGGSNSTRKSRLSVSNSALWYGASAPTAGYQNGGNFPIVYKSGSIASWYVSMKGVTNDNGQGYVTLDDTEYIYNSGGSTTELYRYVWSGTPGSFDTAPKWKNYRVNSTATDLLNGSPMYGLGYSTLAQGSGYLTQLSGYYGLNLIGNGGSYWVPHAGDVVGTPSKFGVGFPIGSSGSIIAKIHVKGDGNSNATKALLLQNSSGTSLLEVQDGGKIFLGNSSVQLLSGSGTPEGNVTAGPGSLFLRNDGGAGTSMYVKESGTGNTGWVGK